MHTHAQLCVLLLISYDNFFLFLCVQGAASGYGDDTLIRQQENFAKKVQNRSRSLVDNDFENMFTRRILVFPSPSKQRPQSMPNLNIALADEKQATKINEKLANVNLNSTKDEGKDDGKNNEKGKEVSFTSLGTSNSFEEDSEKKVSFEEKESTSPSKDIATENTNQSKKNNRKVVISKDRAKSQTSSSNASSANGNISPSSNSTNNSIGPEIVVHNLAPEAFRAVRKTFGFSFKKFASSLGSKPLITKGNGGGRSGARFFLSHDMRFVVKSIILEEVNTLLSILPSYLEHVISNAVHTLLPRFLGLFRVGKHTHFLVIDYVFKFLKIYFKIYIYRSYSFNPSPISHT